jgi:hypothetical protein
MKALRWALRICLADELAIPERPIFLENNRRGWIEIGIPKSNPQQAPFGDRCGIGGTSSVEAFLPQQSTEVT